jgi:hypothetical protein
LNDEERKMCARFEGYAKKIRSKELRFTKEADSVTIEDPIAKEKVSLPTYFGKCMSNYDRQKIDEAGHRTMVEAEFSQPTEENQWSSLTRMAHFSLLDNAEKLRFLIARNALAMIDEALTSPTPLIVEGERYFAKLEECENAKKSLTDERNRLDAELQELSAEILGLKGQHDECQRQLEECQSRLHIHPFRNEPP